MKRIILAWLAVLSVLIIFPNLPDAFHTRLFGSAAFPTSLDTSTQLPNPGATDSVATVSHSALHTNENGAIEALEAKVGTGASTAILNSIFAGNGAGTSLWTTFATTTSLWATNLFANGSTTLQKFTAQEATTSNLYVSTFASTTLFRANSEVVGDSNIGKLTVTSCSGCTTGNAVPTSYFATSTNGRYMAKTLSLSAGDVVWWGLSVDAGSTNKGTLSHRISTATWGASGIASTTDMSSPSSADANTGTTMVYMFQATTTETVTFAGQNGGATNASMWVQLYTSFGFSNFF